ncbi:MAG TPA: helix-turn-helix domain-containing protein [Gaiellaceae bacterium]|nr:helix-turn-helix domain-containing protein [Gaiellaceae bacterium]
MAKRYAQYCPVAHALELVGERWALLIVRELLDGPKRYTDLSAGIPGIGTNILAGRLRDLEEAGVIEKRQLPPPAAAKVYELTPYGEELREPLYALGRWGARSLGPPTAEDKLAPGWLVNAVRATCTGGCLPDRVFELRVDDHAVTVRFEGDELVVAKGSSEESDPVIETDPATLFSIAAGQVSVDDALRTKSLTVSGDRKAAERFLLLFSFDEPRPVSRELEHV